MLLLWAPATFAQAVGADTPEQTASGATFTLPTAWSIQSRSAAVIATPPEADARVAILDVESAADAKDAAVKAWALYAPGRAHPFRLLTPNPPRNGWEERASISYEISANEKLEMSAQVMRRGQHWVVMLLDSSDATAEKRGAGFGLIARSLRPAGYVRESFAGKIAHPLDGARIETLRRFVADSIGPLGVPGAAIALFDHGRVVYEGGVGVRELGKPTPVDAHTLFMVGSNTKGMTTLLLAKLVDEGRLDWDQRVTEVYPSFRLGSEAITKKVLVRHLVCACTGLPRKDYEWIFNGRADTPATVTFVQLAATEPTSGFGDAFQYNNMMASAAGFIGGHLLYPHLELGAAYDKAMETEIFAPLGMKETTFDFGRALAGDHASPHGDDVDGHPALVQMSMDGSIIPYRPAAGAWSSAHDMIKYVRNELTDGVSPDGRQFISAKNVLVRRGRGVPMSEDLYYGIGLQVDVTYGVTVIKHGGSVFGYMSDILAVPQAGVGAVILTNAGNGQLLLRPFMRRLLEVLYDGEPEAVGDVAAQVARIKGALLAERERLTVHPEGQAIAKLATHYVNADLGHIDVHRIGPDVRFDFGQWGSLVATRRNDDGSVSFETISPAGDGYQFVVGAQEGKRTLILRDGQHEYVYVEQIQGEHA